MSLLEKIKPNGPKRILALDGGGIRGILAVEILAKIEELLREKTGSRKEFVLADYFDFFAGTSTGGIIAACLSWGMTVDRIRNFYLENGKDMFDKASILKRHRYKFEDEGLSKRLQKEFETDTTLGSEKLKTLLLLVMRNATTDSPWPVSNNPACQIQRHEARRLQLELASVATGAGQYRGADLLSTGSSDDREEGIYLRRRRDYHVQQPRLPSVPDGDSGTVPP